MRAVALFIWFGTMFYVPLPACTTEDGTGGDSADGGCFEMGDGSATDGGCIVGQGGLGQGGFGFGATGGVGASGGSAGFGS